MSLLNDDELFAALDADIQSIADAKADAESWEVIVSMANAVEQAVIAKLATVSVEPVAWEVETEQRDGTRAKWVSTDKKRHMEFSDFGEPKPLYPPEALAAARVQAINEAAYEVREDPMYERAVRALIGERNEFHSNHKTD